VEEQRIYGVFYFRVGKTTAETHSMLPEAHGNDALSQAMTYERFRRLKNGNTSTDEDKQSGRPSASESKPLIAQVKKLSMEIVD
jgi:hypothetical protein